MNLEQRLSHEGDHGAASIAGAESPTGPH